MESQENHVSSVLDVNEAIKSLQRHSKDATLSLLKIRALQAEAIKLLLATEGLMSGEVGEDLRREKVHVSEELKALFEKADCIANNMES